MVEQLKYGQLRLTDIVCKSCASQMGFKKIQNTNFVCVRQPFEVTNEVIVTDTYKRIVIVVKH